ncbi:MAG: hypothetical protein LBI04_06590 [Treponema sp.]|jgi:hypothetical protein|nr:hypothetical protein [Treponema sp.]
MTPEKLSALLTILNPAIVQMIMEKRKLTNIDAIRLLYESSLYAMMEKEESKLWHLSPLTLYELLEEELEKGSINYPEEA